MQDKSTRQALILELVNKSTIKTQNELQKKLSQNGCRVNQATLSRDIKELQLSKITTGGIQKYVSQEKIQTTTTEPNLRLSNFVESVEYSGNIIVVKTNSGAANYVAESLDNSELEEVLGTVAGDNTILVVVKETASPSATSNKLKSLFS